MTEIIDINKLKELCNKYTVEVPFNGFSIFEHKVIDANKLLEEIHTTSNIDKDKFIENINSKNFMSDEIRDIFYNIKSQGPFLLKGHEALGNHSYIECSKLNWLK